MNLAPADSKPAWCPGCGNYPILRTVNAALRESGLDPHRVVLVSGIGQAAKLPHYVDLPVNVFNGLHGRALPAATGIKLANHALTVVVTSGDGDMYGEGGNHFIHALRRNVSVKAFVHNNQVYALTKGQASPTSDTGFLTKIQTHGVISSPFNPLAVAVLEDAAFVARSTTANLDHLKEMMLEAIAVREGFCLLDILQPCVTFNKHNTFRWYKERARPIEAGHDVLDRDAALRLALEWGQTIPVGILYRGGRRGFESQIGVLDRGPLVEQ